VIDAAERFVVTVEEALPHEVLGTSEVTKKITESGLGTADRLVQAWYELLRKVIGSTAKSLSSRNGATPHAEWGIGHATAGASRRTGARRRLGCGRGRWLAGRLHALATEPQPEIGALTYQKSDAGSRLLQMHRCHRLSARNELVILGAPVVAARRFACARASGSSLR
jgi:hypothetical protein